MDSEDFVIDRCLKWMQYISLNTGVLNGCSAVFGPQVF